VSDGLVKAEEGDRLRSLTAEVQRKLCNSLAYSGVSNVCTRLHVPIHLKELEVGWKPSSAKSELHSGIAEMSIDLVEWSGRLPLRPRSGKDDALDQREALGGLHLR